MGYGGEYDRAFHIGFSVFLSSSAVALPIWTIGGGGSCPSLKQRRLVVERKQVQIHTGSKSCTRRPQIARNADPLPTRPGTLLNQLLLPLLPPITSLLAQPPPDLFPSGSDFLKLAVVVAVAISVAAACSYLASVYNRQANPFCDSDSELHDLFFDSCEPCPSNGHCYEGKLECNPGYKKYGNKCVEDVHIDVALNKLLERIENQLCRAYVKAMCDGIGTIWVPEDELRDTLDSFAWEENSRLDNMAFEYVKERAMKKTDEDFETRLNHKGSKEYKCPVSLAENYKPIFCRIQQWISKHSLILMSVCALLGGCTILLFRVRRRLYLSRRAVEIYDQVCDVLEENALMSRSMTVGDTWVVASRLRDHVLSPLERKDHQLWKKVEELMAEDSRMECYPKLVKGESKVVWEWQVEGSLGSSRKKKKSELIHRNSSADA